MRRDVELFVKASSCLWHGGVVLDIGAGIRPQTLVRADRHICVEPYGPYAEHLLSKGYEVIQGTALEALRASEEVETIVMLDVIEHMDKEEGKKVIELAKDKALQVVIFTPLGFVSQEHDAWNMDGEEWQRHRSGWHPREFPNWRTIIDVGFTSNAGAFFAIWQ